MPDAVYRCACGERLTVASLLDAVSSYDASLGTLEARCGGCDQGLTFRVLRGGLEIGFVYSAGSPHFEALEAATARGLTAAERDDDVLVISLGARRWEYPFAPREVWLPIRPGEHALGRTLAALRLEETGVEVLALDANDGIGLPLDSPEPLTHRHRIRVRATTGARRRAARRIETGE